MPTENTARLVDRPWKQRLQYELCNGVTYDSGDVVFQYSTGKDIFRRVRDWVRTPNFRSLVANKQHLPDNPYSYKRYQHEDHEFVVSWNIDGVCVGPSPTNKRTTYTYKYPTATFGPVVGSVTLSDSALRAKLISGAKGAEWSVPVFIGEGRQTVAMVARTATTLASAYRDLRRGNWYGCLGSLGIWGSASQRRRYYREFGVNPRTAAANHWLQLQYGWKPMLMDVKNAAETLAETVEKQEKTELSTRASIRKQNVVTVPGKLMGVSPHIICTETQLWDESYKGIWRFKPTNLNSWGSFGLLNPALVAWELLPLSFVADWFLPVGRYLEGLDVPLRFDHLGGSIGYRRSVSSRRENWVFEGHPHGGSQLADYVEVSRAPLTGPPTVDLSSIVYEPKLGASRATSAIALLSQALSR